VLRLEQSIACKQCRICLVEKSEWQYSSITMRHFIDLNFDTTSRDSDYDYNSDPEEDEQE
jgi:hypothetical protein